MHLIFIFNLIFKDERPINPQKIASYGGVIDLEVVHEKKHK